jgi:hypothetical protein
VDKKATWNAYQCTTDGLGVLLFESEDPDKFDRTMSPIYIRMEGDEKKSNKINSYMDHVWDGFYAGQIRRSRFPCFVYAKKGGWVKIHFTGTPAKKMKFKLLSQDPKAGFMVQIHYPGAESRQIELNGEVVEYNKWDKTLAKPTYGEIKQTKCGENRFLGGGDSLLEFYIDKGCTLQIAPRDAIQTSVRMEWTMETFFKKGGTTAFVDRLCASLGIHASTVKVVSVYKGSLGVDYEITPSKDEPLSMEQIRKKQT